MKINHNALTRIYKDFVIEKIPLSRKNCPPQKNLINFFRSKLSEKQKLKIIDHITHCGYCFQEFEFILKTLRIEKNLIEKNDTVFRAKKDASVPRRRQKIFFPILSWRYISFLFGVVIIISAVIILANIEKSEYRGTNLNQLHLIEPINRKYSKSSLIFKWHAVNDSKYYIFELFDQTLYPIWKSQKIFKTYALLPHEVVNVLKEHKTYFWMVTAYLNLNEKKKIESHLEKFTLTD